jgi:integrase
MAQKPGYKDGIRTRHLKACRSREDRRCNCEPRYDVRVYSHRDGRYLTETKKSLADARKWRDETKVKVSRGEVRAPSKTTLREAGEALIAGMRSGSVRKSNGRTFKPSTIRSYEQSLAKYVYRDLGGAPLAKIERRDVQRLLDRLMGQELEPMTVRNAIMPLRTIYRRAVQDGEAAVNPCEHLRLPAPEGRRERIASVEEAANLLAALRESDRAVWATAFYAGLRRGELQGLQWTDVDLSAGLIHVRRAWDEREARFIEPKSRAGTRDVPIVAVLREHLVRHRMLTGRSEGFVFGRDANRPFIASNLRQRSVTDWKGVKGIGLHEARHTFASILIAAALNAKAISTYMGHSSVQVTFDRYGHLMPGNEAEAVEKIDAYLARADTGARLAQIA